ncbi:MAG: hypothetical protein LBT02_02270 [Rickettsiales bacterium]|jgi:oligoribonuclease NrnB/cAMP/cGMP phosphodiesterase (DHH superfamily)|nr:hypothetical protein [Rickettsiales bacterium]
MKKNILFTHTDLDGAGCALLLKTFLGLDEIYYISHGLDNKIDNDIKKHLSKHNPKDVNVFITDISPNTEEMFEWLIKNCSSVNVLDHHKSQEHFTKYKEFVYYNGKCGTLLVKEYLQSLGKWEHRYLKDWNYFVEMVNDIDLWILADPFSKDLNSLFFFMGMAKFVEVFTDKPYMMYRYNDIIDILQKTEEHYVKNVMGQKQPCACGGDYVFAEWFGNEVCNELARNNVDHIGVFINMKSKSVSLRSIGDVDVSVIAKANGGGGHRNSSGFSFESLEEVDRFIKTGKKK